MFSSLTEHWFLNRFFELFIKYSFQSNQICHIWQMVYQKAKKPGHFRLNPKSSDYYYVKWTRIAFVDDNSGFLLSPTSTICHHHFCLMNQNARVPSSKKGNALNAMDFDLISSSINMFLYQSQIKNRTKNLSLGFRFVALEPGSLKVNKSWSKPFKIIRQWCSMIGSHAKNKSLAPSW